MNKSISSLLSLRNETFAVCPITGIPYTISFPCLGLDFSYKSPFASHKNLKKICEVESTELKKLPKVTLAGIVLAIMKERQLIEENHIPSFQANTYFQLISSHSLTMAVKFFYAIEEKKIDILPRFALSSISFEVEYSSTTNMLENYIKACKDILHPPVEDKISISDIDIPSLHSPATQKVKSLSTEDKKSIKTLTLEVASDALCNVKLGNVLKLLNDGNTIISIAPELRAKIINRLETLATPSSLLLVNFLNKYNPTTEFLSEIDRASDDFAITKAKKTLAEILADRKAAK